ncbi:O-methyltransferase family 3 protein [Panaeolus papilionaceus]|nr:O-methyltransferase family 3 protein [Panaeolus papilionaceus]
MAFTQEHIDSWKRNDAYFNSFLLKEDAVLEATLKNSRDQGLDNIAVSAAQGKLLNLLAKSIQAKRIIEVGLLGGYSTIWLARALPDDGKLISFEIDPNSVKVAGENIRNAGLESKVDIVLGPAAEELPKLQPAEPFDLVFIDADKESNSIYFREAKRLVRKGGVIVVDNVVRRGKVADPQFQDSAVQGVRDLLQLVKDDPEVETTTIATVGEKGYDGFLYAIKQ